jgi:hypothetical protein
VIPWRDERIGGAVARKKIESRRPIAGRLKTQFTLAKRSGLISPNGEQNNETQRGTTVGLNPKQ